jgi:hypothetical protein
METNFKYIASSRSTEELIERVENRQKYLPETVEASVAELQYRKHEFLDEEIKVIGEDIQAQRENAAITIGNLTMFNNDYKNVIVEDLEAPIMYSRRVIYFFSVFGGALIGSILAAMNMAKIGKRNEALYTVLFGIVFTVILYFVGLRIGSVSSTSYRIAFGLIAAYCLDYFFWKRFIGYSTFYRARSFWAPVIVVLTTGMLVVIAMKYGVQ